VGSATLSGTTRLVTDRTWSQTVLRSGPRCGAWDDLGRSCSHRATRSQTRAVFEEWCRGLDMESHIVAGLAATHRLPMVATRVIIDPTDRRRREGALAMVRQNGTLDIAMLIRSLIKQPREVQALLRTLLMQRPRR
jgi:adenosylhomocysteine nucleosidase